MHTYTYHLPKRIHPGSLRDPIAFASIIDKNSSIRSSLISASTTIQIGMAASDVDDGDAEKRDVVCLMLVKDVGVKAEVITA